MIFYSTEIDVNYRWCGLFVFISGHYSTQEEQSAISKHLTLKHHWVKLNHFIMSVVNEREVKTYQARRETQVFEAKRFYWG